MPLIVLLVERHLMNLFSLYFCQRGVVHYRLNVFIFLFEISRFSQKGRRFFNGFDGKGRYKDNVCAYGG